VGASRNDLDVGHCYSHSNKHYYAFSYLFAYTNGNGYSHSYILTHTNGHVN
jgi:hypothetical protein